MKKLLPGVFLVILLFGGWYWYKHSGAGGAGGDMTVGVKAEQVIKQNMPLEVRVFGALLARNDADLRSETSAQVKEIAFQEGQWVTKGTLLIRLDAKAEEASLTKAQAEAELSQLEYERSERLYKQKAIAQRDLDTVKSGLDAKMAEVTLAEVALAKTVVTAPFDGRLGKRALSIGDYVAAGTELVTIVDKRFLKVHYSIPERYLATLQPGQTVIIESQAFPGSKFTGQVDFVAPKIDSSTRSIEVEAVIANPEEKLSPGLSANVTHVLGENADTLTVPEESILSSIEGQAVFRIKKTEDNKLRVERCLIETGARANGRVAVVKGLSDGDQIVTEGQQKLRDGLFVHLTDDEKVKQ